MPVEQFLDRCVKEGIQNPEALGDAASYLNFVSLNRRRRTPWIRRKASGRDHDHFAQFIYRGEQGEEANRDIPESK